MYYLLLLSLSYLYTMTEARQSLTGVWLNARLKRNRFMILHVSFIKGGQVGGAKPTAENESN